MARMDSLVCFSKVICRVWVMLVFRSGMSLICVKGYIDDNIKGGSGMNEVGGVVDPEQARPVVAQEPQHTAAL